MSSVVINGIYQHYKGHNYRVIALARHTENQEELVIYQALYGEGALWARPLSMFLEHILVDGKTHPRFFLAPENGQS